MNATVLTMVLLAGAVPSGGVQYSSGYQTAETSVAAGEAYIPPPWYASIFCCGGNMPQTCYEPRFGCYSGQSRFTHRYPAFHGTHYRRPYTYRQYFDYPWQGTLHEPTSMFAFNTEGDVSGGRPTAVGTSARRSGPANPAYARAAVEGGEEEQFTEQTIPSMVVPTVDPGYLKYLINEVARGVTESEDQEAEAAQVAAEQAETEIAEAPQQVNQVSHIDPKSLAAAVTRAQLYADPATTNSQGVEPAYEQPAEPVVVKATPLTQKEPQPEWRRRSSEKK